MVCVFEVGWTTHLFYLTDGVMSVKEGQAA
jgi:hypothetical protein